MLVDYFSNFIELDYLPDTSSLTVIRKLKMHFARHGVPDCLVTDNSPQYISSGFRQFAATWKFKHVTTSPPYPEANGKAESAVKTSKSIMKKSLLSISDPYPGLLDHRILIQPQQACHLANVFLDVKPRRSYLSRNLYSRLTNQ